MTERLEPSPNILAWGGTEPRILLRLYKVYTRLIFEYGSVCFLHCPDATISIMQKIQNRAIRICLRLPQYVSLKLLLESTGLPFIKKRLVDLGSKLVARMTHGNPLICAIVEERENEILQMVIQGQDLSKLRSHRSPLDIILPAQRPFLSST